jgi:hypothetical protein
MMSLMEFIEKNDCASEIGGVKQVQQVAHSRDLVIKCPVGLHIGENS